MYGAMWSYTAGMCTYYFSMLGNNLIPTVIASEWTKSSTPVGWKGIFGICPICFNYQSCYAVRRLRCLNVRACWRRVCAERTSRTVSPTPGSICIYMTSIRADEGCGATAACVEVAHCGALPSQHLKSVSFPYFMSVSDVSLSGT